MPAIIAVIIGALLFISGAAVTNKTLPKTSSISTPTPPVSSTPTMASSLSPTQSLNTPTSTPTATIQDRKRNKVIKVIDGDTIQVSVDGKTETIRLIGIDSPETVDPRKPVQCFGKEASSKAKEMLSGKDVMLEADSTQGERDKYDRLLRYIYLEDGTNINMLMIRDGYAHEYTYQSNPYKYQGEFIDAEQSARDEKKGLWADNVCITPMPTILPTSTPTKPTSTPIKSTSTPTSIIYVPPPVIQKTTPQTASGGYTCNCGKVCGAMSSCEEAYFQLNQCGCSVRDADKDGIPCESICN